MRVGVTGGSGFIGTHVIDCLIENGYTPVVLDLRAPLRSDVEFIRTDILDPDSCRTSTIGMDAVYHLAAIADVNVAIKSKRMTIELNVQGTSNILDACENNGVSRFVFASTEWVYNCLAKPGELVNVDETAQLDANKMGHVYTLSKYLGELLCQSTCTEMEYTILRFGIPYGPHARPGTVFYNFLTNAMQNIPLRVNGQGLQFRKFIYIRDLAYGCVAALNSVAANRIYNLSGDKVVRIRDLAESVRELFHGSVPVEYQQAREQDFGGVVADNFKALTELNWAPKVNLQKGLKYYYEWLLQEQATRV